MISNAAFVVRSEARGWHPYEMHKTRYISKRGCARLVTESYYNNSISAVRKLMKKAPLQALVLSTTTWGRRQPAVACGPLIRPIFGLGLHRDPGPGELRPNRLNAFVTDIRPIYSFTPKFLSPHEPGNSTRQLLSRRLSTTQLRANFLRCCG